MEILLSRNLSKCENPVLTQLKASQSGEALLFYDAEFNIINVSPPHTLPQLHP